jgi:hypothetical protein
VSRRYVGSVAGRPLYGNASPSSQMTLYECSMIVSGGRQGDPGPHYGRSRGILNSQPSLRPPAATMAGFIYFSGIGGSRVLSSNDGSLPMLSAIRRASSRVTMQLVQSASGHRPAPANC